MNISDTFKKLNLKQINDWINNHQEENLFIDFKTIKKPDFSNRDDRKNFAKAMSGFANSSGGLIIWGIIAKKTTINNEEIDCATEKSEIKPLSQFISRLNNLTGELVDPIIEEVRHKDILIKDDRGFAATLVPESASGPHMAKGGEDRYYKRSGDSFYRMEHFDIEDMFGRRKKPKLALHKRIIHAGIITQSSGQSTYKLHII